MTIMNKNILKSIWAVVAGFVTVVILSIVTDFILESIGVFPPQTQPQAYTWIMLLFALIYRSIYTVIGGYVTASLAPDKQMRHAVILGIIGIVAGSLGAIAGWHLSAHWYPIMIVVTSLPCTWLGGKLHKKA